MKVLAILCRILLGLIFVVFGLNGFLHFIPMGAPPPAGSVPANFMSSMTQSGILAIVYAAEVLGGLLVLVGGTVPLGLAVLCPVTFVALLFHLRMAGGHGIAPAAATALLELLLVYAYRSSFAGILTLHAAPAD